MSRLLVGTLVGVFGIRGELKCAPTSLGASAIAAGRELWRGKDGGTLRCTGVRRHHGRLILTFDGVTSVAQAQALVGSELFAEADDVELGPDDYLDRDLIGLVLRDGDGRELGSVVAVEHFPAQDCLVVGPARALVPLVRAYAPVIDLAAGTITMSLPEGLLEL